MAPILASKKTSCDYIAYRNIIPTYELSFGSSLARVGRLGVENNCHLSNCAILFYYHIISGSS